jgi:hypothetical protein
MVVDLFAGSGSTLSWIKRHAGARRAIGFELDNVVFELASKNLRITGPGVDLRHDSCQHGLQAPGQPGEDLQIVFVSPPWGHALSQEQGLGLRRTQPPVPRAADATTAAPGRGKLLFAMHVCETVEPGSLAEVTARFPWPARKAYDINAPGQKSRAAPCDAGLGALNAASPPPRPSAVDVAAVTTAGPKMRPQSSRIALASSLNERLRRSEPVVRGRIELPTFRFSGRAYPELERDVGACCAAVDR